ncbi:MAG: PIN domain-containing protein [Tissierellia bacterium]|nr:PIN domain-containing protein [Tissierellia bacterium]
MTNRIVRMIATGLGALLGFIIMWSVFDTYHPMTDKQWIRFVSIVISVLFFAFIFYIITPKLFNVVGDYTTRLEKSLKRFSTKDILTGTIGLIIGLILAFMISQPLYRLELPMVGNVITVILSILIFLVLGYVGVRIALSNKENLFQSINITRSSKEKNGTGEAFSPKILDTSVIIDGRIKDIVDTGFLEGDLIIPIFVLEELQHIADSDNDLRRQKGRRGLDVLKLIQKKLGTQVVINNERYPEIDEVDSKILKMAQEYNAKVLTNDFNLNKVANVQNILVLNINELANAMKPVVFPGENLRVKIIKEGKELNQGIGYLDDGTMIVVENGRNKIGETVDTIVTSVLQTAAGKMIFVKIQEV